MLTCVGFNFILPEIDFQQHLTVRAAFLTEVDN